MQYADLFLAQLGDTGMHQQEIEAVFDGKLCWEGSGPVIPHPLVVIAFTNRSGSNHLAELMRSTGRVAGLGEALNADTVARRCEAWGVETFPGYFTELAERHRVPFGVKASWDQLLMLLRCRIPEMHEGGLRVVHIRRRDVVGQAISREIAWQTGKWTSLTPVETQVTPRYDADRITRQVAAVVREDALFPMIFEAFGLAVTEVTYEALVRQPAETLRHVMQEIGQPCPEWTPSETRLAKQADATNDAFRAAYREVLAAACRGHDRDDPTEG
jgi:LPS sulfotransferase NodH